MLNVDKKTAEKKNCSKEALLRPELSGWRSNSITSGLSLIIAIKTRIEVSAGKQGGTIMKKGSLLQLHCRGNPEGENLAKSA